MRRAWKLLLAWSVVGWLLSSSAVAGDLVQDYTERYLQTFPTQATAAGRTDLDARLERLDAAERAGWLQFNIETLSAARGAGRRCRSAAPYRSRAAGATGASGANGVGYRARPDA